MVNIESQGGSHEDDTHASWAAARGRRKHASPQHVPSPSPSPTPARGAHHMHKLGGKKRRRLPPAQAAARDEGEDAALTWVERKRRAPARHRREEAERLAERLARQQSSGGSSDGRHTHDTTDGLDMEVDDILSVMEAWRCTGSAMAPFFSDACDREWNERGLLGTRIIEALHPLPRGTCVDAGGVVCRAFVVEFVDGEQAIFKFGHGAQSHAYAELAAHMTDRMLGIRRMPPATRYRFPLRRLDTLLADAPEADVHYFVSELAPSFRASAIHGVLHGVLIAYVDRVLGLRRPPVLGSDDVGFSDVLVLDYVLGMGPRAAGDFHEHTPTRRIVALDHGRALKIGKHAAHGSDVLHGVCVFSQHVYDTLVEMGPDVPLNLQLGETLRVGMLNLDVHTFVPRVFADVQERVADVLEHVDECAEQRGIDDVLVWYERE